jgi:serine/threonine protein kinase
VSTEGRPAAGGGETIGGYRVRNLLQTGQLSQVYEVVEPSSNRHLAMKVLLPEAAANAEHRRNLFHEAEVGQKLAHENIVRIVRINRDPAVPFFVMEFFPSGSLRVRLVNKDTAFIREQAAKIFRQVATGLAYMHHKGYVHRDIKPDNLLVNAIGDLKLIDFAISRKVPTGMARWFYRKSKPQGTRSYMAPQQIRDEIPDPRDDIYSLGCTLYELVCGRPPFRGRDSQELLSKHFTEKPIAPKTLTTDLTDDFNALLLQMLAKKREDRPKNMHEVLIALKEMRIFKVGTTPTRGRG